MALHPPVLGAYLGGKASGTTEAPQVLFFDLIVTWMWQNLLVLHQRTQASTSSKGIITLTYH